VTSPSNRTTSLFETDLFLEVARGQPFWVVYGYTSTKTRTIRSPLIVGFVILTVGIVGFATIQPSDSTSAIVFPGLAGLGFGASLVLIIPRVQPSTPHHLIATATSRYDMHQS
jgi:zinc transporter ZupT